MTDKPLSPEDEIAAELAAAYRALRKAEEDRDLDKRFLEYLRIMEGKR